MRAVSAIGFIVGLSFSVAQIALPDGRSLTPADDSRSPCDDKKCDPGQTCTVLTPVCKKLPCDPIGVCVGKVECRRIKCAANCEFGYEADEQGCQTCTCKENPCNLIDCKPGTTCKLEQVQCFRAPCNPIGVCKPQCSRFTCMIHCEYGRVRDENGCTTCRCKPHPCAARLCGPGSRCVVVRPECVTQPCDPMSECQKIPDEPTCKFGSPLPSIPNCGRGGERCPDTHFCNIHPADRYAVCCAKKRNPCDTQKCEEGYKCVVEVAPCLVAPCPEFAACKPLEVCELVPKTGHCMARITRYYHDAADGKCKSFFYGGCGGNKNNFKTLQECNRQCTCPPNCEMHCEFGYVKDNNGCDTCKCKITPCATVKCGLGTTCVVVKPQCVTQPCDLIADCQKIPDEPTCEFGKPLPSIPNCGRGGERCPDTHLCNIHPTDRYAVCCPKKRNPCDIHDCRVGYKCVVEVTPCLVAPCPEKAVCKPLDVCELPSKTGHCRARFMRYYHDAADGKCKTFIYGGCGGNANNFRTLHECNRRCTCPPNCRKYCEFGYVRSKEGCDTCQCKPSPCAAKLCPKGTQCEVEKVICKKEPCPKRAVCRPTVKNICTLPKVSGPCKAYMPHYYFDSKTGKCTKFIYGGCGGNKNRFKTLWECQQRCECPGSTCFAPPCKVNSCPAFPTATCRASLCNCRADFFIGERQVDCRLENNQVGLVCRPGTCGGVTDFQCVSHRECGRGKKCSKGCCGSSCQPSTHPGFCPQPLSYASRCKFDSTKHCLGDHQCARDEKCCTHKDGCTYCDKAIDYPRRG